MIINQNNIDEQQEIISVNKQMRIQLQSSINWIDIKNNAYVKLTTLLKNNNLNEVPQEYIYSQKYGIIKNNNNQINIKKHQIIIGRSNNKFENIHIDLTKDKMISHNHCKLLLRDGWKHKSKLSDNFVIFLSLSKRRNTLWYQIPKEIYRIILDYAKSKQKFTIKDLGSKFGTYIRLNLQNRIQQNDIISIGYSNLLKCYKIEHDIKNNLINNYVKEIKQKKISIIGNLEQIIENKYNFSILGLSVENYSQKSKKQYVFFAPSQKNIQFFIGRYPSNDLVINHSQISRRHSIISYKNNIWYLIDGNGANRSSNGCWKSIKNIKETQNFLQSQEKQIVSGDQIRIGQTYFRFQVFNNK